MNRFREQGYEATPISELTREAGVAKGTFFNHFPSKEHILASWFVGMWNETARSIACDGTDAIVAQYLAVTEKLLQDPVLAMALVTRMAGLPALEGGLTAQGAGAQTDSPNPLDTMRQWTGARIAETLPVVVPIQPVSDEDLSAVLVGSLMETLRELLLLSSSIHTSRVPAGKGSKRAQTRAQALVTRLRFQLASAGFAVS
jgi:AcrR family transcriptional regulator